MKRILFVIDHLSPFGGVQRILNLSCRLDQLGYGVAIVSLTGPLPAWANSFPFEIFSVDPASAPTSRLAARRANSDRIELATGRPRYNQGGDVGLDPTRRDKTLLDRHLLMRRATIFSRWVADWKPDLIQACGAEAAALLLVTAAWQRGAWCKAADFIYSEFRILPRPPAWLTQLHSWYGTLFRTILVPHKNVESSLRQTGWQGDFVTIPHQPLALPCLPTRNSTEINNCRQRLRQRLGVPEDAILAGTIAPLIPSSRLKDLIWSADLLNVVRGDFYLAIWGVGDQYHHLENFARSTVSADRIFFCGVPNDVDLLIPGIDMYWHSHLDEPQSVNLIDQMQRRIPVIGVYGGGTSELIRHQQTGLGVRLGGRDEFASWSKYLIEQPLARQQLVDQAAEFIHQTMADDYDANYIDEFLRG